MKYRDIIITTVNGREVNTIFRGWCSGKLARVIVQR